MPGSARGQSAARCGKWSVTVALNVRQRGSESPCRNIVRFNIGKGAALSALECGFKSVQLRFYRRYIHSPVFEEISLYQTKIAKHHHIIKV